LAEPNSALIFPGISENYQNQKNMAVTSSRDKTQAKISMIQIN
jgi:hypothetical protein